MTALVLGGAFFVVKWCYSLNLELAAIVISVLNALVPNIFKVINALESHKHEGSYQASLYVKITIFRWINTAIITAVLKPFTATLDGDSFGLIPAIFAVMRAEIFVAPTIALLDIVGHIKRFILAPFAVNQPAMDSHFRGAMANLGEKYTVRTHATHLLSLLQG